MSKNIKSSYLAQLADDYEAYMNEFEMLHPDIPVIRIDGDKMDFVKHQDDLENIISQVKQQMQYQQAISKH